MVTGVPGAGKTLIGLSVATLHQNEEHSNRSVYLSGNRPLVMVLQEALARDARDRSKLKLEEELAAIDDKNEKKAYKKANKVSMTDIRSWKNRSMLLHSLQRFHVPIAMKIGACCYSFDEFIILKDY